MHNRKRSRPGGSMTVRASQHRMPNCVLSVKCDMTSLYGSMGPFGSFLFRMALVLEFIVGQRLDSVIRGRSDRLYLPRGGARTARKLAPQTEVKYTWLGTHKYCMPWHPGNTMLATISSTLLYCCVPCKLILCCDYLVSKVGRLIPFHNLSRRRR